MKILITDGLDPRAIESLRKRHHVDVEEFDSQGLLESIPSYHAVIVRGRTKITREVFSKAKKLKVVARAGVGVDNIDLEAATSRKIPVVNAPTSSTVSVAELAIGHMISLLRRLPEADRSVKAGRWEKARLEGHELFGKQLGLIGSGRIGAEVSKRAQAFGMLVTAYDPYLSPAIAEGLGILLADKESVLRGADVISVHAALTDETRRMIGAAELAMMKRQAILVNCARGEIVDDEALAEALRSGTIAGAAVDVFSKEPPTGSPLLSAPNVVFTPHLGASTIEGQARAGAFVAEQVLKVLDGSRPDVVVNPAVYG